MSSVLRLAVLALLITLSPAGQSWAFSGGQGGGEAYAWRHASGGWLPRGALKGGHVPAGDLYVCRSHYRGGTHVGKLWEGKCLIGWGGKEVARDNYEVLTVRGGGERGGRGRWVDGSAGLPRDAVRGGHAPAGELYICRARYREGVHLGKAVRGNCLIGWGGKEVEVRPFEILVGRGMHWTPAHGGRLPAGAVGGGRVPAGRLFVCRGRYHDGVHPGKFFQGKCLIGWGGKEVALSHFEVLTGGGGGGGGGLRWVRDSHGRHRGFCVRGGNAQGREQCVCRGRYADGVHVGKTFKGKCNIGWGGKEIILDHFEVLVTP